jgi:hypothetical protein
MSLRVPNAVWAPSLVPAATHVTIPRPPPSALSLAKSSARPIPGGGRILASGPEVLVVTARGRIRTVYSGTGYADAYWDPGSNKGIIVKDPSSNATLEFSKSGDRWVRTGRWRIGPDYYARISPDGRWMAYSKFRHGRQTKTVRIQDRAGHVIDSPLLGYQVVSWTSDGRVILQAPSGWVVWDPETGSVRSFLADEDLAESLGVPGGNDVGLDGTRISWSADGRYFASSASWGQGKRWRGALVIGTVGGTILRVVPVRVWGLTPTWSPVRPEVAFSGDRHQLFVLDVVTGRSTLVLRRARATWWAAWSPRGDWLLLADSDAKDPNWLFVSRYGRRRVEYPSLGDYPRWASPGADAIMQVC